MPKAWPEASPSSSSTTTLGGTIRDMRRRIASEQSPAVTPGEVGWRMVESELRSGTALPGEMELERYIMLAGGSWEFGFEISVGLNSRLFDIHGGKLRVTILANYRSAAASAGSRASTFRVTLKKREVASAPGGSVGVGYNPISSFTFTVGVRGGRMDRPGSRRLLSENQKKRSLLTRCAGGSETGGNHSLEVKLPGVSVRTQGGS